MKTGTCYSYVYNIFCLFGAIVLTSWCVYEYYCDHDITDIALRKFHETPEDIHPSITLCNKDPFRHDKTFEKWGDGDFLLNYVRMIRGDIIGWDNIIQLMSDTNSSFDDYLQQLNEIDYDNVTVKLEDFIYNFYLQVPINAELMHEIRYDVSGNSLIIKEFDRGKLEMTGLDTFEQINTYISARHPAYKCFTFDVPLNEGKSIREIGMTVNASINTMGLNLGQFYTMLTFPMQTLKVPRGKQIFMNQHNKRRPNCYKFEVYVGAMEVYTRRDKSRKRCNVDWSHHDKILLNNIMEKVGCNPKNWKIQSHLPNCSTLEEYHDINQELDEIDGFMPPCRSIETISKITKGTDKGHLCFRDSYLEMKFYLDEETYYKEIILVPAYTLQSLIGNAGKIYLSYNFFCKLHTLILIGNFTLLSGIKIPFNSF